MTSEGSLTSNSKKRRIMIITADESIIEQIQNNTNASLFKSIILDSDGDNIEVSHSQVKDTQPEEQSSNPKKAKISSLTCVVCGSSAHGYNFDAISCESCKAFFRRNALKNPASLECRRNSDCDVTLESRRRCLTCRLNKCLNNGMKRDRILTTEQKATKRRKIEENRTLTLRTTTEISKDNQKLKFATIDEKPNLLSSTVVNQLSPSKNTNILLLKDPTDHPPQERLVLLSAEDIQRVETIQVSYEQRIELAARDGLPYNPSVYTNTLLQHLNSRSVSAIRLLSFFKQIPEFNELDVHDRVILVKYNLMPLVILNSTLAYDIKTEQIIETVSDAPWNASLIKSVHGEDIYNQVKKIFDSFLRIAQQDQRIIHLALIVLILTKGFTTIDSRSEPILNDSAAVYRAQTYYTELLWKYLESVHGRVKAIHIFNELITHFISWKTLQGYLHSNLQKILSPTEISELLPIMQTLLHIPEN